MQKLLYCFLVLLLMAGCKKYPENSGINLATKKRRVMQFGYLEKFVVNGIDSTAYLSNQMVIDGTNDTVETDVRTCYFKKSMYSNGGHYLQMGFMNGRWEFEDKKTALLIGFSPPPAKVRNIWIDGQYREWKIMKLTKKEMHLTTIYAGNTYDLYFVPLTE